jgi:hypothetical protein
MKRFEGANPSKGFPHAPDAQTGVGGCHQRIISSRVDNFNPTDSSHSSNIMNKTGDKS